MKALSHILQELAKVLREDCYRLCLWQWKSLKIVKIDIFLMQLKTASPFPPSGQTIVLKSGKVYTETRGITKFRLTQKDEIINTLIILITVLFKGVKLYNIQLGLKS